MLPPWCVWESIVTVNSRIVQFDRFDRSEIAFGTLIKYLPRIASLEDSFERSQRRFCVTVAVFRFSLWHREGALTSMNATALGISDLRTILKFDFDFSRNNFCIFMQLQMSSNRTVRFCTSDADLQFAISSSNRMYVFATKYVSDRPAAAPRSPSIDLLPHEFFLFLQKLD